MTQMMKTLIAKLEELPEEEQDRYAAVYLAELEDDRRWEELFARTTEEQWEKLAQEARTELARGESVALDALLKQR